MSSHFYFFLHWQPGAVNTVKNQGTDFLPGKSQPVNQQAVLFSQGVAEHLGVVCIDGHRQTALEELPHRMGIDGAYYSGPYIGQRTDLQGDFFLSKVIHQPLIFNSPRPVPDPLHLQTAYSAPDALRSGGFPGMGAGVKTQLPGLFINPGIRFRRKSLLRSSDGDPDDSQSLYFVDRSQGSVCIRQSAVTAEVSHQCDLDLRYPGEAAMNGFGDLPGFQAAAEEVRRSPEEYKIPPHIGYSGLPGRGQLPRRSG